jgi:ABC-2 type transport system ATP-binding protein
VTIILTTHYLEEAEAMADRIGVINKGRAPAGGGKGRADEAARAQGTGDRSARADLRRCPTRWPAWSELAASTITGCLHLRHEGGAHGITRLLADIQAAGLHLRDVETRTSSLEEIFVGLVATDGEAAP